MVNGWRKNNTPALTRLGFKMILNDCLRVLQCNRYSTIDDIKKSYRVLSKRYHPDLNKSVDPKLFIELTDSYDYLLKHHVPEKPKAAPRPKIDNNEVDLFFRVHSGKYPIVIELPITETEKETMIFFMLNTIEYRIKLHAGVVLPVTLDVHDALDRTGNNTFRVYIKKGK